MNVVETPIYYYPISDDIAGLKALRKFYSAYLLSPNGKSAE
jgi:hypothetical protein